MSLLDHAIWWHVYPLGACGAPIRHRDGDAPAHRLPRLLGWLDHAVELGCSGLLLGPVFESTAHGYDTLDHFRIDSRLGDDDDFDALVAACRERGLSIMLDGVFNHVGMQHPLVEAARCGENHLIRMRDGHPVDWEGHGDLAELDHSNPAVADLVVDVMLHWLRRGIAGWRLDVAYAVPTDFWRDVTARVRQEFPDALFLGEVLHGDYAAFAEASTLDSITQYELWKGTWSSIHDRNFWELAHALERHDGFASRFVPNTFVGNHDVARIATLIGDGGAALAATVLFTVPGMPSIYYGDEHGFRGAKGEGYTADDDLRPALPESPSSLSPAGEWLYRLHQELIGLRRRNPWLTRGRLAVVAKDNTSITYEVTGGGHTCRVELALDPAPRASVRIDGAEGFRYC